MSKTSIFGPLLSLVACLSCAATTNQPDAPVESSTTPEQEPAADSSQERSAEASPGKTPTAPVASIEPGVSPAKPAEAQRVPLPEGTKVLHVGDSFAGALGLPLGARFEAAGVKSVLKHTDASYLTTWAWEGDLQKYLWKYNPDLVIVTLGANELEIVEPEQRERTVKKIIETIGARPCLWVAIPLWKGKQNGLMDVIERSVGACTFMDTNKLMDVAKMPRIKDGIHPTSQARADWADLVVDWLETHRDPKGEKPWTLKP